LSSSGESDSDSIVLLLPQKYANLIPTVVGGFDNASYYGVDRQHPHFGGVPGRYANRIKNSSFVIDGETFHILPNENPEPGSPDGVDTLHGGPDGWDVGFFSFTKCYSFVGKYTY